MLNPHTLRIIIWFVFSIVGCILFLSLMAAVLKGLARFSMMQK